MKIIKSLLAPSKLDVWLALFWTCIIFYLSLKTVGKTNISFPYIDKIVHVSLYFLLIIFWSKFLYSKSLFNLSFKIILLIASILLGVLIELLQEYCTLNRHAEAWDVFANSMGCVFGLLFFESVLKKHIL